jgi:hypothetical protein
LVFPLLSSQGFADLVFPSVPSLSSQGFAYMFFPSVFAGQYVVMNCSLFCADFVVWTSLGPLPRWVPGPTTRWAPGTTRLALHGT